MSNNEPPRYPSRLKKKKNRSNAILNGMIGLVFALILITGAFIFLGSGNEETQELETVQIKTESEEQASDTDNAAEEANATAGNGEEQAQPDSAAEESDEGDSAENSGKESDEETGAEEKEGTVIGGTITSAASSDPIVEETVINTSWEPVKTSQKGDHVSVYEKDSVDWKEKVEAISYATGLKADNMYIMRIQNGGGPQKSIGVVQSKDQEEKYRVHLEWVDGKGWKPVKMDILKTLEGAY
ncbi:DUF1510 family protein [Planomicrobium sp. CPCC 101110]|uniref:DUF1510 family protein n=1 Tax=Planomicrobium sp. CPCC 101110 TaxID=2599619 RepID=UPI0011B79699|nr:DUF1510 family protein [Planomicrobium sp. CPCC 101110]TWT26217.1 DUF1510 family protein [Planomicrobium sp. CPCC 101110]